MLARSYSENSEYSVAMQKPTEYKKLNNDFTLPLGEIS